MQIRHAVGTVFLIKYICLCLICSYLCLLVLYQNYLHGFICLLYLKLYESLMATIKIFNYLCVLIKIYFNWLLELVYYAKHCDNYKYAMRPKKHCCIWRTWLSFQSWTTLCSGSDLRWISSCEQWSVKAYSKSLVVITKLASENNNHKHFRNK